MTGSTLRVGLLSTARINRRLVAGARELEDVEVVAVGSRSRERAAAHAAQLGLDGGAVRVHGSYEEVLADPEVDAVYVALPNAEHVPWSVRALEAGKHVLCEKPLTRRVADAERAFAAADTAGRVLAEAFMWRHTPQAAKLRELLAGGAIGEVRAVRAAFSFLLDRPGDARLTTGMDGGALMDVGCYCVSGARFVFGDEPVDVGATMVRGGDGVDVRTSGWLRFGGDRTATFDCGFDLVHHDELVVLGTEGTIRLDDPWHSRSPGIDLIAADDRVTRVDVPFADPFACELRDLAAAVRGEQPHPFGRDDAIAQARVIESLHASAS